jgi:hypothetical protein
LSDADAGADACADGAPIPRAYIAANDLTDAPADVGSDVGADAFADCGAISWTDAYADASVKR